MADQQFCLRWNNHQNTLISVFDTLLEGEILVDCTLAAEGKFLRAHKVVLSACSPFFSDLLRQHYEQHPILIMKDVKFDQLKAMLDYMYRGEVKISQDQLGTFLKAAESLQIKGLSDSAPNHEVQPKLKLNDTRTSRPPSKPDEEPMTPRSNNLSPPPRRKRRRHPSGSEDDVTEESSSELVLDPSSSPPPRVSVNSRLTNPSSPPIAPKDCSSVPPDEVTSRPPPFLTTSMFSESDPSNQQSASLVDSVLCEPKSEFIELDDDDEDMTPEDAVEAGPSHKTDGGGYSWHMERPEDSFLSQESLGGHRNAQGFFGMWQEDLKTIKNTCYKCNKSYKNRGTLIRHLRFECGVEAQFICPLCNFACKQRYNLTLHMRRQHPNDNTLGLHGMEPWHL